MKNANYQQILSGLKERIRLARQQAALVVNTQLLAVYWDIGHTILKQQKAQGWGAKIIDQLAVDLKTEFPDMRGFSVRNIKYMRAFAEAYPNFTIVQPSLAQLQGAENEQSEFLQGALAQITWYHHITLLTKVKDEATRLFYIRKTVENGWSRDIMLHQIESSLHLRQGAAITNFKATLPKPQSDLARETLKNPYLFDFIGVGDEMQERDIERALTANIKKFMLELGKGYAYVGNQYNLVVEDDDFFLDLLFYNYRLHCFVVFELKVGAFKPEYAGKLNFYINTVNQKIKGPEDKPTIGVLLCRTPNETVVEYSLQGIQTPMGVAEYELTKAVPKELQGALPTIEALEQEMGKEVAIAKSPMQEKLKRLKGIIAKTGKEEVQREKSKEDVFYLFNELLPQLQKEIEQNLADLMPEFTKVEIGRNINGHSWGFFTTTDLEAKIGKENITVLGLSLRMEGFKKAGVNSFGIWKDLLIELHQFKYDVGTERHKPWMERMYHQEWTREEIRSLAERWCEVVIDDVQSRLDRIG
jgi:predicted nuclease of restriction endonuclease-like (RecB) superfamily